MTSISIDFRYQSILIGGLNRLTSMISIDFRYRLLSINYFWIWSITIITNGSLFPIRHFSKASLRSKATWVWQWNWEKFNLRLESPSCRKQTSILQKNRIQKTLLLNETNKEAFNAHDKRAINFTTIHSWFDLSRLCHRLWKVPDFI